MKKLIVESVCLTFLIIHLSPLTAHASTAPTPDSANFCAPIDYEQLRRDHPHPAAKRLAGLNVGVPLTVRMIYFLPSDRSPQQDIDAKLDEVMKNVQLSYEEVMEYHGFGKRTFRLETDATGKAVVHHVKGKFNDEYYHKDTYSKVVWQEMAERYIQKLWMRQKKSVSYSITTNPRSLRRGRKDTLDETIYRLRS